MTNRKYAHDDAPDFTTWDGEPVGSISPHGAIVVCVRSATPGSELLILHRAHTGVDYEGASSDQQNQAYAVISRIQRSDLRHR